MQYEVGIYVSGILLRVRSMPNGEIIFYDLPVMMLFVLFLYSFGRLLI